MIDPRVTDAIRQAAADLNQPPPVADYLISWLEALSNGNEGLDNRDDTKKSCDRVYKAVVITEAEIEEDA